MKKIGILLVIVLILSLALSVVACDNNTNNNNPNNNSNNNSNNNNTNENNDGFISASTTIEELSEDLVKSLLNTAKTASNDSLNVSTKPCVSWHIELDVLINDLASVCIFEINFDKRDKSATEMKLLVVEKGKTEPFVSLYFFQDEPLNDKNPGTLYVQYGDAKVKVPVVDTFLGQLFPISFSGIEESVIIGFLSANLFTKGDIQHKYKDNTDGTRTRNYVFQVDLKATLINIVNMLKGSSDMYDSVSWIIESLFGVESGKISTQLPDTTITVDVTTAGGTRKYYGKSISNLKIDASVAASDYKDSIFRGESYKISLELVDFKASSNLIEDFPKEDSALFDSYLSYANTAMILNGALVYLEDEETIYDISVGFRYDGLADAQNKDEVMIVVTEKDKPDNKIIEFYAFDNVAYFNFYCAQGGEYVETQFPFDIDHFIEYMIEIGSAGDSFGFLKTVAYTLGSIQIWEDGSLSLNVDEEFYLGLLNLDIDVLVKGIEDSCTFAGGTTQTISNQLKDHNTDLSTVLSNLVIEKEVLLIFDNGTDSIDTTDNLIDKTRFN